MHVVHEPDGLRTADWAMQLVHLLLSGCVHNDINHDDDNNADDHDDAHKHFDIDIDKHVDKHMFELLSLL